MGPTRDITLRADPRRIYGALDDLLGRSRGSRVARLRSGAPWVRRGAPLRSTPAELLRGQRHKSADADRRPPSPPLHALPQPVIPTRPMQLAHRHEMPREVLRQLPLPELAFPILGGDVGIRDLTVERVRELPGDPVHVL